MTRDQFSEWWNNHKSLYPGLARWATGTRNSVAIMDAWFQILEPIDLAEAKTASKRLFEAENQPRSYERHAVEVKRRALEAEVLRDRARSFSKFGEVTYACRWCCDSGLVSLFCRVDPKTRHRSFLSFRILADVQTKDVGEKNLHVFGGFRCCCRNGERFEGKPKFDPERHIPVEGSPTWRADTNLPDRLGESWWDQVAERFERSSTAAFAGQIGPDGF